MTWAGIALPAVQVADPDEGLNPFLAHARRYQLRIHSGLGRASPALVTQAPLGGGSPATGSPTEPYSLLPLHPAFVQDSAVTRGPRPAGAVRQCRCTGDSPGRGVCSRGRGPVCLYVCERGGG